MSFPPLHPGVNRAFAARAAPWFWPGEADHRDELLTSAERAAGAMLLCVSRARSERLALDL